MSLSLCFKLQQLSLLHSWPLWFHALITTVTVAMALISMEIAVPSSQYDVVLPPPLILTHTMTGVFGLATVPQWQPKCQMPSQLYANFTMGHQGEFFCSELSLQQFSYAGVLWYLLSGNSPAVMFTNGGSNIGVYTTASLWSKPLADTCVSWCWSVANARSVLSGYSLNCIE